MAVAAVLALGAAPCSAATTFTLDATAGGNSMTGNFWLTFVDEDNDQLFSLNELSSFSGVVGVYLLGFSDILSVRFDTLTVVPQFDGFTDGGGPDWSWTNPVVEPEYRNFSSAAGAFSYRLTEIPSVPLPASGVMLLGALAGLGWARLRRGKAAGRLPEPVPDHKAPPDTAGAGPDCFA